MTMTAPQNSHTPTENNSVQIFWSEDILLPIETKKLETLPPLKPDLYVYNVPDLLTHFRNAHREHQSAHKTAVAENNAFNTSRYDCAAKADMRMIDLLETAQHTGKTVLFSVEKQSAEPTGFAYSTANLRQYCTNAFGNAKNRLEAAIKADSKMLISVDEALYDRALRDLDTALDIRSSGKQYMQSPVAINAQPNDTLAVLQRAHRLTALRGIFTTDGFAFK